MTMRSVLDTPAWASTALVVASETATRRSSIRSSWNVGSSAAAAATTWRASPRYSGRAGISSWTSATGRDHLVHVGVHRDDGVDPGHLEHRADPRRRADDRDLPAQRLHALQGPDDD